MTRQASRDAFERASGSIPRIGGPSSLLQPYVPGHRPVARTHARSLTTRNHDTRRTENEGGSNGDITGTVRAHKLADVLERVAAATDLEDALRIVAAELPETLGLARVVVTLDTPRIAVDSQATPTTDAVRDVPTTVARVTRPLWLVPRQPAVRGEVLEIPVEASRERMGLLRAWVAAGEPNPAESVLPLLRITGTTLGQQVLLHRSRAAESVEREEREARDEPGTILTPGERQRWNTFLGYVAHEVKTPLTCIQGHAQLLSRYVRTARAATKTKRGTLARLLDDCERHLPALEKQVARIEQLLRDMLDLARSDEGDLALVRTHVNLVAVVNQAIQSLETELACEIAVDAPETLDVQCDAARIEQVLRELLRYVARGGGQERPVRIHVTEADDGENGRCVAQVTVGYEEHTAKPTRVTRRASSAQFGTNSATSLLDLRLMLSAAILRQHGGSLYHFSDEAGGSEVVLALPIPEELHPSQIGEIHGAPDRTRGR